MSQEHEHMANWPGTPGPERLARAEELKSSVPRNRSGRPARPAGNESTEEMDARALLRVESLERSSRRAQQEIDWYNRMGWTEGPFQNGAFAMSTAPPDAVTLVVHHQKGETPTYTIARLLRDPEWAGLNQHLTECRDMELHVFGDRAGNGEPGLAIITPAMAEPETREEPADGLAQALQEIARWHGARKYSWHPAPKEPPRPREPSGTCRPCGRSFSSRGMGRHLATCRERATPGAGQDGLRLTVKSADRLHWLHLEMPASSTLEELNSFLRRVWLEEPCGHLSQFISGEQYYREDRFLDPHRLFGDDLDLRVTAGEAIRVGETVQYEYDMGDTTTLTIRALEQVGTGPGIRILARNDPPDLRCQACSYRQAELICNECSRTDQGMFCQGCAGKHEGPGEFLNPLVNSPRTGVCGYTGDTMAEADPPDTFAGTPMAQGEFCTLIQDR